MDVEFEETTNPQDDSGTQEEQQVPAEQAESPEDQTGVPQESDTATDEHKSEAEINQEAVNKAINKKHAEAMKAKQEAEELRKRAEKAEAELAESTRQQRPEIPAMPDPYDDDFKEKMAARDEAILKQAEYDQAQKAVESRRLQAQQDQLIQQKEAVTRSTDNFYRNSDELGIDQKKLDANIDTVLSYGIKGEIGMFVLNDPVGPLIVNYLAANPLAMEEVANMGTAQAAVYIETKVKPEAVKLKAKTTNTPPPPKTASGGGAPPSDDPLLAGVTFS